MALPLLGTGWFNYLHINHVVFEPSIAPILSGLQFHEIGTARRGESVNLSGPQVGYDESHPILWALVAVVQ